MSDPRVEIFNTLTHRVNSFSEGYRQNIAIIGDPHVGKTSLIKALLESSSIKRESVIPIYMEIKIEPFEFCIKRFIKASLSQLLYSDALMTAPPDAILLIQDLEKIYPKIAQICKRVLQDIERGKLEEAYSFMLDIPSVISEETKKRCILILDEFHNLDNFILKNPFNILAKKIMIQKDTMYLLLSSRSTVSQRLISEKLSMLFGNFEKIILGPFDINLTRTFLHDNLKEISFPPAYLDFIGSFLGNKPLYMRIICDEIERLVLSKKIPANDYARLIETAFTEAVFKKTGMINQHFFNFFSKISEGRPLSQAASVLISLSCGNKKQQDIARSSKLQLRDISRILGKLVDMDIIARNGSFYRFKDCLFSFWLRHVYMKRIMSFSIDEAFEENYFNKEVMQRINIFMQELEKELSFRIADLFRLFKNDIVQLNGKKHRFCAFNNIEKLGGEGSPYTNIMANSGKVNWLCSIRKEFVTENDILEIIKDIKEKKKTSRIKQNILISLAGISDNAHLLAKEAKIWVWDLGTLNVLMELYGKPYIV